jgi:hypothetical protein
METAIADCLGIFLEPAAVFKRRTATPVIVPLAVLVLGCITAYYVSIPLLEPAYLEDFKRGIATHGLRVTLTSEQLAAGFQSNMRFGGLFNIVTIPLTVLCIALSVWIACAIVGVRQTYERALVIATWSYFPRLAQALATPVIAMFRADDQVHGIGSLAAGVTFFVDPATSSAVAYPLLLRVDLFTIWTTILICIGVMATSQTPVSRKLGACVGFLVYVFGFIPAMNSVLPV